MEIGDNFTSENFKVANFVSLLLDYPVQTLASTILSEEIFHQAPENCVPENCKEP